MTSTKQQTELELAVEKVKVYVDVFKPDTFTIRPTTFGEINPVRHRQYDNDDIWQMIDNLPTCSACGATKCDCADFTGA